MDLDAVEVDWLGLHRDAGNVAGDEQINRLPFHLLMTIRRKTFHGGQGRELSVRSALKPSRSCRPTTKTRQRYCWRLALEF